MLFDPDRWPGPQNMYPPEDPKRPVPWWREPMVWLFGAFGVAAVTIALLDILG
jgi:hypothetical protein